MARPLHTQPPLDQLITKLLQSEHFLSAPKLLEALEKTGVTANKTSIYRSLDKLLASGTVCKLNLQGNDIVYELTDHHHDHAVCESCGSVQTVACQHPSFTELTNFTVNHHHLTLYGLCQKCQTLHTSTH